MESNMAAQYGWVTFYIQYGLQANTFQQSLENSITIPSLANQSCAQYTRMGSGEGTPLALETWYKNDILNLIRGKEL